MKEYNNKEKMKFELYGDDLNEYIQYKYGVETFGDLIENIINRKLTEMKVSEKVNVDDRVQAPHLIDRKSLADLVGTSSGNIIVWERNNIIKKVHFEGATKTFYNFKNAIDSILKMPNLKSSYEHNLKMSLKKFIL